NPTPGRESPWVNSDDAELAPYLSRYQERKASYLRDEGPENTELDCFTFPRGQVIRIIRGDLVAQKVDALVSSDTGYVGMDYGVSEALRRAGGDSIADEARHKVPVRPGRALVTSAGRLSARFVFHGVTVGYVRGQLVRPSRDLLTEIMSSCFYHA